MKYLFVLASFVFASCSNTYFIVRHGEKAPAVTGMGSDVELSAEGKQRAESLKETLKDQHIAHVYSTNTIRTKSTAQPTAAHFNLQVSSYGPRPDSSFIASLKLLRKNTLIVGHSNTIDDVVNLLCGSTMVPGDLPETAFDNLFVVKRKGKRFVFEQRYYGVRFHAATQR